MWLHGPGPLDILIPCRVINDACVLEWMTPCRYGGYAHIDRRAPHNGMSIKMHDVEIIRN